MPYHPVTVSALKTFVRSHGEPDQRRFIGHVRSVAVSTAPQALEIITDLRCPNDLSRKTASIIAAAAREWVFSMGLVDPYTKINVYNRQFELLKVEDVYQTAREHRKAVTWQSCP